MLVLRFVLERFLRWQNIISFVGIVITLHVNILAMDVHWKPSLWICLFYILKNFLPAVISENFLFAEKWVILIPHIDGVSYLRPLIYLNKIIVDFFYIQNRICLRLVNVLIWHWIDNGRVPTIRNGIVVKNEGVQLVNKNIIILFFLNFVYDFRNLFQVALIMFLHMIH